jgi:class I fructose-bisphosphate aldolase
MINLDKISRKGKALYLAYDQGLEHGPTDFNDESVNPENILKIASSGFYTGLILQKGIAEKYPLTNVPLILKLNGKTKMSNDEPMAEQICSVEEAVTLGAAAVGYTIYLGSEFEEKMMHEFAAIEVQAHEKNLPVVVWMYPRGTAVQNPDSVETIAYAARVGLEIGADVVKVRLPMSIPSQPSLPSLSWIVKSAGRCRVVFAGGAKLPEAEFLEITKLIMSAGAYGLAVGRNVWQNENPEEISKKLAEIVFPRP